MNTSKAKNMITLQLEKSTDTTPKTTASSAGENGILESTVWEHYTPNPRCPRTNPGCTLPLPKGGQTEPAD